MKRLYITVLLVALGFCAAYAASAQYRFAIWVLAGRSPVCPLNLAIHAEDKDRELMRTKDRILSQSKLLAEENGLEHWDTPKGSYWIPKGNRYVLPFNLAEMEHKLYGSGTHFVQPGDVVLDCGASDGDFTREALAAGAKLVVSIEISPPAVECIRRNLAREIAEGRVIVYPKGVWNEEGSLTLNVSDSNFAANSVVLHPGGSHRDVRVPLTTIDRIVDELGLAKVDFVKMDIEGAEVNALSGARNTINRFKPRMSIATEHKPDDEVTIPNAVRNIRHDYTIVCGPCSAAEGRIHPDVLYFQ